MKKWIDRILIMLAMAALAAMCLPLQAIPATAAEDGVWIPLTSPTASDLNRCYFTDADTGWLVGLNGEIWHTDDGGETWDQQTSNTTVELEGLCFLDDGQTGWVVGSGATMLHTTNGGGTWTAVTLSVTQTLRNVQMVSATEGWANGWGTIVHTTNGTSWVENEPSSDLTTGRWLDGAVAGSGNFWAVGIDDGVGHTDNSGTSWTIQDQNTGPTDVNLYGIMAFDADNLVAWGGTGVFVKTSDGGDNWTAQLEADTGISAALKGGSFYDTNNGVLVGSEGGIYHTDDGGDNWTAAVSPTDKQLQDVFMVDADTGYAVGYSGTILKYTTEDLGPRITTNVVYSGSGIITLDPVQPPIGYTPGTVVTCTAVANDGFSFVKWTGDATGTELTSTVTMDADKSITANFLADVAYRLVVNIDPYGSGTVTLDPAQPTAGYAPGTEVTITAAAESGYHFREWSGGASGRSATTTITMDSANSVTASFGEGSGCCAGAAATATDIGSSIGVVGLLGLAVTCLHFRKKGS